MKRIVTFAVSSLLTAVLFAGGLTVYAAETQPAVEEESQAADFDIPASEAEPGTEIMPCESTVLSGENVVESFFETEAEVELLTDPSEETPEPETPKEEETTEPAQEPEKPAFQAAEIPSWKSSKNVVNGVYLKWKAVTGAAGYIISRKEGIGKWVQLTTVTAVKYTDTKVKTGKQYTYRVRAFGADGQKGKYDKKGTSVVYAACVKNISAANTKNSDVLIKWDKVKGASGFRVLRREPGGSFKKLKDVGKKVTSFHDKSAESGKQYEYIVKAYKTIKKKKYFSAYNQAGIAALTKVNRAAFKSALPQEDGIQVNWKKVKGATGYELLRKEDGGKWTSIYKKKKKTAYKDTTAKTGVKYTYQVRAYVTADGKTTYGVKSKKISATRSNAQTLAAARLKAVGGTLRAAYNWAVKIPYSSQPAVYKASGYAKWSFENGAGDCLGKAAVFCLMAKELGYETRLMYGYVPRRGGGTIDHGWVEIKDGGNWYICDPDFEYESGNNGYFINYGQSGTWMYQGYYELPY